MVFDRTGIGAAIADLFAPAKIRPAVGIMLTAGADVAAQLGGFAVPKRDAVSALVVLLESGRLEIARSLQLAPLLEKELREFRMTIKKATGHETCSALGGQRRALALALLVKAGQQGGS